MSFSLLSVCLSVCLLIWVNVLFSCVPSPGLLADELFLVGDLAVHI